MAGRAVLLVPEVHREDVQREARQDRGLAAVHRVQRDVLPDALPRPGRDEPADRDVPRLYGAGQHRHLDSGRIPRPCVDRPHDQSGVLLGHRSAGRAESVGR